MKTYNKIETFPQDTKEETVEAALQVLIITLDQEVPIIDEDESKSAAADNLFLNYLSRIHREEDFAFILKGVTRLLMNPLAHTYLPYSQRKIQFHQELLIFFWKFCEHNKKFLFYVLKSSDVLDILVSNSLWKISTYFVPNCLFVDSHFTSPQ